MSDDGSLDDKQESPSIGVYEGSRNADKLRHGRGKNTFPNGDVYEGQYVNGKRYGEGSYTWKQGHSYVGSFQDNQRHGQGVFTYPDGSKYNGYMYLNTGHFTHGKRHGQGSYLFVNGDIYQGEWANDIKEGKGTILVTIGIYSYVNGSKGLWVKGRLDGEGSIIHADHKISGVFLDNDVMQMPVEQYFFKTGYSKTITDHVIVGMASPADVAAN